MIKITILSKSKILELIRDGRIEIAPLDYAQVGPTSIDLTLGSEFRVFKKVREIFHVKEEVHFEEVSETVQIEDEGYLLLMPGELVHGITKERIKIPNNVAGRIEGRSRFARIGLMVHMTAGLVQPGCDNKQVLSG